MLNKNHFAQNAAHFACARNSGFLIRFDNGYSVDVGFTPLHFCSNYHSDQQPQNYAIYGSNNGELAIAQPNGRLVTGSIIQLMGFDWCDEEADILENATPLQFALIANYLARLPVSKEEEDD